MYHQPTLQKRQLLSIAAVIGIGVAGIVLILVQADPGLLKQSPVCQIKQPQASITNRQAMKLLTLKQGLKRSEVLSFMQEPYCQLTALEVRVGTKSRRDVYPLDSDTSIWVVILYEDDQYVGYRFTRQYKVQ